MFTSKTPYLSASTNKRAIAFRRREPFARLGQLSTTLRQWMTRRRQRQALFEIAEANDHHLLKDIGVSREEALREATKPFWKP